MNSAAEADLLQGQTMLQFRTNNTCELSWCKLLGGLASESTL